MPEYIAPPIWLGSHIQDPRTVVGSHTYFDERITLAVFTPDERIEIGKFCSIAKDVVILGGGNHIMTRVTTFPFKWLSIETQPNERFADAALVGLGANEDHCQLGFTVLQSRSLASGSPMERITSPRDAQRAVL
jgi:hypothetical protein